MRSGSRKSCWRKPRPTAKQSEPTGRVRRSARRSWTRSWIVTRPGKIRPGTGAINANPTTAVNVQGKGGSTRVAISTNAMILGNSMPAKSSFQTHAGSNPNQVGSDQGADPNQTSQTNGADTGSSGSDTAPDASGT